MVNHPLQPFDARNFIPGGLVGSGPWSFDTANLEGARAAAGRRDDAGPPHFLLEPLDPIDDSVVEMRDLESFLRSPVNAFLRQRLGVSLSDWGSDIEDSLPVDLDGLETWQFAERLLGPVLAGGELEECLAVERARGMLPPGALSDSVIDQVVPNLEALVMVGADDRPPTSMAVNIMLRRGTKVVGTVPWVRGDSIHTVTYSRMSPKLRVVGWLRLLALSAALPERQFEAVTIARGQGGAHGSPVSVAHAGGIGIHGSPPDASDRSDMALTYLEMIVDLYLRAMREPPPLYCEDICRLGGGVFTPEVSGEGGSKRVDVAISQSAERTRIRSTFSSSAALSLWRRSPGRHRRATSQGAAGTTRSPRGSGDGPTVFGTRSSRTRRSPQDDQSQPALVAVRAR